MESEAAYLARRAAEERAAAMRSAHPKVREVHLEMAALYDERLRHEENIESRLTAHLIGVA